MAGVPSVKEITVLFHHKLRVSVVLKKLESSGVMRGVIKGAIGKSTLLRPHLVPHTVFWESYFIIVEA